MNEHESNRESVCMAPAAKIAPLSDAQASKMPENMRNPAQ
jgi:hypothetical protein